MDAASIGLGSSWHGADRVTPVTDDLCATRRNRGHVSSLAYPLRDSNWQLRAGAHYYADGGGEGWVAIFEHCWLARSDN